jgi:signal transduction histidine kinase
MERPAEVVQSDPPGADGMTSQRRQEEQRLALTRQMMEGQKLQALGELAAGIAHEINNPMAYILSNLGRVSEYTRDLVLYLHALESALHELRAHPAGADLWTRVESVRRKVGVDFVLRDLPQAVADSIEGSERVREIVRALKDYAHADEGERRLADLNALIESTIHMCWNTLKQKATVHRDYGALPSVPCYPSRLHQVFVNLLVNAAQAIREKGDIWVTTYRDGDNAVVRIRDSGCGIPPHLLSRIFEPFFTTKPAGVGSGLGLHVAHRIIRAHRGTIRVASEEGKGTEFSVYLPTQDFGEGGS